MRFSGEVFLKPMERPPLPCSCRVRSISACWCPVLAVGFQESLLGGHRTNAGGYPFRYCFFNSGMYSCLGVASLAPWDHWGAADYLLEARRGSLTRGFRGPGAALGQDGRGGGTTDISERGRPGRPRSPWAW